MMTAVRKSPLAAPKMPAAEAVVVDVCLVVEGCYPYVPGGVSSWIDWLIRTQPGVTFSVVAIVANEEKRTQRYQFPDNVRGFSEIILHQASSAPKWRMRESAPEFVEQLADALIALTLGGGAKELGEIIGLINKGTARDLTSADLLNSRLAWGLVCRMYDTMMPHASFLHFYWAWRALFGGLFATLKAPLARARAYHTISTGYAGLYAARAAIETGRPAIITEHGIYTNERRIEILMAEWIVDTIEKGLSIDDERIDLRDVWVKAFDAYARACYDTCESITTLYEANQRLQLNLGAKGDRLKVIANGIDIKKLEGLPRAGQDLPPTIALIGRVVPIKDVKTFISAVAHVRKEIPDLKAMVLGPTDEDPVYFEECAELVRELGLEEAVTFTGNVKLSDYLPKIHVVVLTSLSEAQPLVILEAGAAGIPCVTTDVGSCREMLEGSSSEMPKLGTGGFVTNLVAPKEIAEAVTGLLRNSSLREKLGETLRQRVRAYYGSDQASEAYSELYRTHCVAQSRFIESGMA